ncbi:WG repeat-containing protein [Clostridium neuense]|uniref:WG repeat-containing protein n=1 Tax=Clostridium neuense TaxID=1728934 RepID=A0ABW8TDA7_9CLOT
MAIRLEIDKLESMLKRDPFENYDEYGKRVLDIKPMPIGRAILSEKDFDSETGFCYIKIQWYGINCVEKISSNYFFCIISKENVNGHIDFSDRYDVYGSFIAVGDKVYINEQNVLIGINGYDCKVYCMNLSKNLLEDESQFGQRIRNMGEIPIGKIKLNKDKYDIKTNSIILEVMWNIIDEVTVPAVYGIFAVIDNSLIKKLYKDNIEYTLYGKLMSLNKKIKIDMGSMNIKINDSEIKIYAITINKNDFYDENSFKENLLKLNCTSAGTAKLNPVNYDCEKRILNFDVAWKKWTTSFVSNLCSFFIELSKEEARKLFMGGNEYNIYINFKVDESSITIGKIIMVNFYNDIEVKFRVKDEEVNMQEMIEAAIGDEKCEKLSLMRYINEKGKYGYMDSVERRIVIEPKFDYIGIFNDEVARVNVGDNWGFINQNGEMIIEPKFELVRDFHEGVAAFMIKKFGIKKWGYINKEGKIIIKPIYDEAGDFNNGIAKVRMKKIFGESKELIIDFRGETTSIDN